VLLRTISCLGGPAIRTLVDTVDFGFPSQKRRNAANPIGTVAGTGLVDSSIKRLVDGPDPRPISRPEDRRQAPRLSPSPSFTCRAVRAHCLANPLQQSVIGGSVLVIGQDFAPAADALPDSLRTARRLVKVDQKR
jgi:hypothetical protein